VEPVAAEPSIAERLAELRKLNGLTLEELAQRASLTKSYLSKLERDCRRRPLALCSSWPMRWA
jgi:DNA-binding XRE family transcriptional regulator